MRGLNAAAKLDDLLAPPGNRLEALKGEARVRAHVLLCMLAYHVEWHMRRALAPILFDDDDKAGAEALRRSVVARHSAPYVLEALGFERDGGGFRVRRPDPGPDRA